MPLSRARNENSVSIPRSMRNPKKYLPFQSGVGLSLLLTLVMTDWACTVKHRAFSEEKEWRIITYPKGATLVGVEPADYEGVSVRPTARLLLPYMSLEPPSQKRLPLIEIRCGPSQFQEQSARAMNILLRKHGYKNLPVTLSRVPLRV
jgi:hypothetical protein